MTAFYFLVMHTLHCLLVHIVADLAAAKPVKNGIPQAAVPAAKKKEKATLLKKESKANFVHPWLACNLKGHSGPVLGLDFSPNGKYLASCSEGSFVQRISAFHIITHCVNILKLLLIAVFT